MNAIEEYRQKDKQLDNDDDHPGDEREQPGFIDTGLNHQKHENLAIRSIEHYLNLAARDDYEVIYTQTLRGDYSPMRSRSTTGIRQVPPLADRLSVRVLIENVWNGFCERAELFRDYLDELASPWVGAYLDLGNMRKFGPTEEWIRVLRHRIVKLDMKDWSHHDGFCKIGDGDVNWPEVQKALAEINFTGWCTAEVPGGDRKRLEEITQCTRRVLKL